MVRRNKKKMVQQPQPSKARISKASMDAEMRILALAIADAFGRHAAKAKYPDGASNESLTVQLRQRVAVTTDTEGEAAVSMYAGIVASAIRASATVASGVVTWGAASSPDQYSSWSALANTYRITSAGMSFKSTAPSDANGGVFYYSNHADQPASISEVDDRNVVPAKSAFKINATPLGSLSRQFVGPSSTDASDWTVPSLIFQGCAASTQVGIAEMIWNVEFTPKLGSVATCFPADDTPFLAGLQTEVAAAFNALIPNNPAAYAAAAAGFLSGAASVLATIRTVHQRYIQNYNPF